MEAIQMPKVKVGNYYLKKRNDIKNARYYFEMAVENKNPEGQLELGKMYEYGQIGINPTRAIKFYRLSSEQGYLEGTVYLAGMFEEDRR